MNNQKDNHIQKLININQFKKVEYHSLIQISDFIYDKHKDIFKFKIYQAKNIEQKETLLKKYNHTSIRIKTG